MVTVETRPLQPAERQLLSRMIASAQGRGEAFAAAGLTFVAVGSVALLLWPWQQGIRSLPPVLAALVAGFLVYRRMRAKRARWHSLSTLQEELATGQGEITTYEVVDAIAVQEQEDEGSQYFLKLRDERVLFIVGQYLYEFEDSGRFPNTKFQMTRTPRTRHLLAFHCIGDYLPPSSRRRPFTAGDHRSGSVPEDGAIWQGDFDSLRREQPN